MCPFTLLLCLAFASNIFTHDADSAQIKEYDGFTVYHLNVDTPEKADYIKKFDGLEDFNFWLYPTVEGLAHLMVAPKLAKQFEQDMMNHRISYKILNQDIGQLVMNEAMDQLESQIVVRSFDNLGLPAVYDFNYFPRYKEILNFMNNLVRGRKYSKLIEIGQSSEGRPMYAVEVMKSPNKPVFVIDAGIHGREWASHVAAMYIMRRVVEREDQYAKRMSFVIVPCVNPDGLEYSHKFDRMWRKSRSRLEGTNCRGVDLNRNFDSHWREFRAESDPCTDNYAGSNPFSEPESIAIRNLILKYEPVAYLTLHSYGPLLLYPWGFTTTLPPHWRTLDHIAQKVAKAMEKINGVQYEIGSSTNVLYAASGGSDDWAMEKAAVPLVYTIELPDYNGTSFILPKKMIRPMVRETHAGFVTMVNNIAKKCYIF